MAQQFELPFAYPLSHGPSTWWDGPADELRNGLAGSCATSAHGRTWVELRDTLHAGLHQNPYAAAKLERGWRGGMTMGAWTNLPEYADCPWGALSLRLWHLRFGPLPAYEKEMLPYYLATGIFAEEIRLLIDSVSWGAMLVSGWAHIVFHLLDHLSSMFCFGLPSMCEELDAREGPQMPPEVLSKFPVHVRWHVEVGGRSMNDETNCSFYQAMLQVASLVHYTPSVDLYEWWKSSNAGKIGRDIRRVVGHVQKVATDCVHKDTRLVRLLSTRRLLWRALAIMTDPGSVRLGEWEVPTSASQSMATVPINAFPVAAKMVPLGIQLCDGRTRDANSNVPPLCMIQVVNFRVPDGYDTPRMQRYLEARLISVNLVQYPTVHVGKTGSGAMRQLEIFVHFAPMGALAHAHEACETYYGASFFRLTCGFQQGGRTIGKPSDAGVASVHAFKRQRPPSLYVCSVPEGLDASQVFEVHLFAAEFSSPLKICVRPALREPELDIEQRDLRMESEVAVCSRPLFDVKTLENKHKMMTDWLFYHRELGVDRFVLYDADGTLVEVLTESMKRKYNIEVFSEPSPSRKQRCIAPSSPELRYQQGKRVGLGNFTSIGTLPWDYFHVEQMGCPEIVFNHCLHYLRGRVRWLLVLRAPDKYLTGTPPGGSALRRLIERAQSAGPNTAMVGVVSHDFGDTVTPGTGDSDPLIARYIYRTVVREDYMPWVTLMDPLRVAVVTTHHNYERTGFSSVPAADVDDIWVNHYLDWHGNRRRLAHKESMYSVFNISDNSSLWALPALMRAREGLERSLD